MKNGDKSLIPPEIAADNAAILEYVMHGKPLDPELVLRVRARAERIREEVLQKHGVLDIGTPAIRELRESE
jgi:hypothetical protein